MTDKEIGRIITGHTVFCGLCIGSKHLDFTFSKLNAEGKFRSEGWKKTKKYGWVCPCHKKKNGEWV